MARVIVTSAHNFAAIAHLAGSSGLENVTHHEMTDELEVHDVSQADLDAAFADYTANQVARDQDFQDHLEDVASDAAKDQFDDASDLTALIKEMVDELNVLRALHALPDLNFGTVNAAIRSRIGNP